MKIAPFRLWTYFSLGLVGLAFLLAFPFNQQGRILTAFVLPPFVAALTTTPRRTAVVIAASIAGALVLSVSVYGDGITTSVAVRLAIVLIGCALALQTAILRERDLRTRRRLALINNARVELEAAEGLEDDLASFARAAVIDFAEWAFLDIRVEGGEASRLVFHAEHDRAFTELAVPVGQSSAATAAYESRAEREGAMRLRKADDALAKALFEKLDYPKRGGFDAMIIPVHTGDVKATYFLICPDPHPPWGEAELTQAESLARAAALSARNDQLIDQLTFAESEVRASHDQIEAIVSGIADGVAAQSADGTMVYVNDVAAEMLGYSSAEEMFGESFHEVRDRMDIRDEYGKPFAAEDMPSRRALRGEEEPEALLKYTVKATGREWWTLVKSRAIRDENGEPVMAITVIEDLTERRRSELAQRFLADAGKALNEPGDLRETALQIASACVPAIADWCAIDMLGDDAVLRRIAILPESDEADEAEDEAPEVSRDVVTTGIPDESAGRIVVPLMAHGTPVGAISLAQHREGGGYSDYDVETVLELGRRAGVALAEARDQENRTRMLETLSASLLPSELPSFEGLTIATRFRPAEAAVEVSGDFYDAFEMADGSVALVIGDVCGKGPEAAALTSLARYTIRTDAMRQSEPSAILRTLNEALMGQVGDDRFCTVALARIRNNGGTVRAVDIASGGHPLPIIASNGSVHPVGESGTLLGVVEEPELPTRTVEFAPGSSIVLYTDGLAAGTTTDDVGFALGLVQGLGGRPADELASAIEEGARSAQRGPSRDDVAILVARAD